jgi:hypothetical protein
MALLNWNGIDDESLHDVIENMRQAAAIVEMVGVLFTLKGHGDDYDQDTAVELMADAGHLGQALGVQALKLLDAQAAPASTLKPRERRPAKRKAA